MHNRMTAPPMLEAADLTVGFGSKVVVRDASVRIRAGTITTVIGVNGSGKSTLIKTMSRMIPPLGGTVYFQGTELRTLDGRVLARRLAYLSQRHIAPDDVTVEELVYYGRYPHKRFLQTRTAHDRAVVEDALAKTGLTAFRERRLFSLSGGESQRAWIAMCLAQEPEVMILDEPTTFLDVYHQLEVLELLRELNRTLGLTIVMVLHDLNQAMQYSDEIVVVHEGRIHAQGAPRDVLTADVLYDVFRIRARCVDDAELGRAFLPYADRAARRAGAEPADSAPPAAEPHRTAELSDITDSHGGAESPGGTEPSRGTERTFPSISRRIV